MREGQKRANIRQHRKTAAVIWGIIFLLLCLTACGTKENEYKSEEETGAAHGAETEPVKINPVTYMDKNAVYELAQINLPFKVSYLVTGNDDQLYAYGMNVLEDKAEDGEYQTHRRYQILRYETGTEKTAVIYEYGETESLTGVVTVEGGIRESVQHMAVDEAGALVAVIYMISEDGSEEYRLLKWDAEGNELWSVKLDEADSLIESLVCLNEEMVLTCGRRILIYGADGSRKNVITVQTSGEQLEKSGLCEEIDDLYVSRDGQAYLAYTDQYNTKRVIVPVDLESGQTGDFIENEWLNLDVIPGRNSGYDVLLKNRLAVYGWNIGEEAPAEVMNFLASGIDGNEIEELIAVKEGRLATVYRDERNIQTVFMLSKVPPELVKEKKEITIGLLCYGRAVVGDATRFNRNNSEYSAKIIDYSKYSDPLMQLGLDISLGQGPDVLAVDWYSEQKVPMEDYARQGAFEDLYSWFEKDQELKKEDFLDNVFEANAMDGKLFYLPTAFSVRTFLAKASLVGDTQGWTMEEMRQLEAAHPDSKLMLYDRGKLLRDVLAVRWDQFVDEENGSCTFNSEEFMELLEWVSEYPEKESFTDYAVDWYRKDKLLVNDLSFQSFSDFNMKIDKFFGEKVTFVGIPGADGCGGLLENEGLILAISAQSGCKEGAWQFIRYYLSDDYQQRMSDIFPVKLSALEKLAEETMHPMFNDYYHVNGNEVEVFPPTQEMMDEWIAYLRSVNRADLLDNTLYNIVAEEAEAFFVGQKSVSDVAEIIQKRVQIYIGENQ